LKISIITPTFNSQKTINENINSILIQNYKNWEQIIIDNLSTDNTLSIIKKFNNDKIKIISEKDKGIYDAINKGIINSTGEIISILHSDDFFFDKNTLTNVTGNLLYVKKSNKNKVIRYWQSNNFKKGLFYRGWSPPHPSFFVKKKIYEEFGNYKIEFGNSSDFELMFRLLEKNQVSSKYIDKVLVTMRYGGASNKNYIKIIKFVYIKFKERLKQFFTKLK
jgi:glycosyltransferase